MNICPRALLAGAILALAAACSHQNPLGPPDIHYGTDSCAGCGMIISDDRFAAAIVNPTPDTAPLLFDDIGCLLAYEQKNPAPAPWCHYFHDARSHRWIAADQAFFVKTSQQTPMGSSILCFQSPADAAAEARQNKTDVFSYSELLREEAAASAH